MDKDRKVICKIISKMLDNPDKIGIYPTSTAYTELEHYIEGVRAEAIGWTHADACTTLKIPKCPQCGKEMIFWKHLRSYIDIYTCPDDCEGKQSALVITENAPKFSST